MHTAQAKFLLETLSAEGLSAVLGSLFQLTEFRNAAFICAQSPDGACPSCLLLPEVEAQFQSAISQLAAVRDRICSLHANINHAHDTFFSRLPLELCSRIFLLYQRVQKPTIDDDSDDPERWDHYISVRSKSPYLLQAVCKTWRTIALSTPGLWTDFDIPVTKRLLKMTSEDIDSSLGLCLSRSGSQLISLRIHTVASLYDQPYQIWEVLRSTFHKCEELFVSLPPCFMYRLQSNEAPCLKKLRVIKSWFGWGQTRHANADFLFKSPPRPEQLDLFEARSVKVAWDKATKVKLMRACPQDFYDLLRNGPRLRKLSISSMKAPDNAPSNVPIIHNHLSHLTLCSDGIEIAGLPSLFENLTLPALSVLKVQGSMELPSRQLEFFIARSKPPLRNLQLRNLKAPGAGFISLLSSTPTLTSLEISDKSYDTPRGIDCLLINHLAKTAKNLIDSLPASELFLPKLEKFSCRIRGDENDETHLDWRSVLALFPTHAQVGFDVPSTHRVRPLHDVTIDIWSWDSDDDSEDENSTEDGEDEFPIDFIDEELIPVFSELRDKGWLTVRNVGRAKGVDRDFIAESASYHNHVRSLVHDGDADGDAE